MDRRFGNVGTSFTSQDPQGCPDFGRISFKISVNYNLCNKRFSV